MKQFISAYAKHRKMKVADAKEEVLEIIGSVSRTHDDLAFYGFDVSDIRQEAWVLALQALESGKVDHTRNVGAFLYRHTRNKLIALRRDQGGFDDIRNINGRKNLGATELRKAISFAVTLKEYDGLCLVDGGELQPNEPWTGRPSSMEELRRWQNQARDHDFEEMYNYLLDNFTINARTIFLKMMDDCPVKPWQRELVRREASELMARGGWGDEIESGGRSHG